jgi:(2Fe-2S) ferredoxin
MTTVKRIASSADLRALYEAQREAVESRVRTGDPATGRIKHYVLVCTGGGCIASGALDVKAALEKEIKQAGLAASVKLFETGCLGPCAVGPVAVIYPDGVFYENLTPKDAAAIVRTHLKAGKVVERLAHKKAVTRAPVPALRDIDFLNRQTKIVLRNCGVINPLSIEEYIGREGYLALAKALTSIKPEDVI